LTAPFIGAVGKVGALLDAARDGTTSMNWGAATALASILSFLIQLLSVIGCTLISRANAARLRPLAWNFATASFQNGPAGAFEQKLAVMSLKYSSKPLVSVQIPLHVFNKIGSVREYMLKR